MTSLSSEYLYAKYFKFVVSVQSELYKSDTPPIPHEGGVCRNNWFLVIVVVYWWQLWSINVKPDRWTKNLQDSFVWRRQFSRTMESNREINTHRCCPAAKRIPPYVEKTSSCEKKLYSKHRVMLKNNFAWDVVSCCCTGCSSNKNLD